MPFRYKIRPELNIAFLIWEGDLYFSEYIATVQELFKDQRYRNCMIRIADIQLASEHFELGDMHSSIKFNESVVEDGLEQDHVVVLTSNEAIHIDFYEECKARG